LTGYDDLKTCVGEKNPMSMAAARRLRELYTAWNKPAEAARFAQQETSAASINPVGRH
jgi:hypothetical protein